MEESCILRTKFISAAKKGSTKKVKMLFKTVENLPAKDEKFYCALYFAALNGHEEIVNFLLEQKVSPNIVTRDVLTPLHAAAFANNKKIVQMLLNYGADVDPKIKVTSGEQISEVDYLCSPLLVATYQNNEELVSTFLQNGANVNVKLSSDIALIEKRRLISKKMEFEDGLSFGKFNFSEIKDLYLGYSNLHFAVVSNNEKIIEILVKYGANLEARCAKDLTPLCLACLKNNLSLIDFLLKLGADMNAQVKNGKHLLRYIIKPNDADSLNRSDTSSIKSFLDYYAQYEKEWIQKNAVFRHLLKIGADANAWSRKEKESLLHYAVRNGMVNAVHVLLKYGANSNVVNGQEETPLEQSVKQLQNILKDIQDEYADAYESCSDDHHFVRLVSKNFPHGNRKKYNLADNKYVYNVRKYNSRYIKYYRYTVLEDPDPFRMISQLLTQDLVRLEALGKRIVQQNVKLLATDFVKPYYNRCRNELKKMKKHSITKGVNYHDFLLANDSKLIEYMKNENIASGINKEMYRNLFPNYCRFLDLNIQRGLGGNSSSVGDETDKWAETEK